MTLNESLIVAVCVASSGCAMGLGIVDVGTKRTSSMMVSDVTYQGSSQLGNTRTSTYTVDNIRELKQDPEEAHVGMMAGVHGGANTSSIAGHAGSGWALETFLEIMGGRGRWALGARTGYMIRKGEDVDLDGDGREDASTGYGGIPMTVHAYYGLSSAVSTHVGLGGDIVAFGDNPRSLRVMTGLRIALSGNSDGATLIVIDVDHLRSTRDAGDYRSFGVIGGLAFVK